MLGRGKNSKINNMTINSHLEFKRISKDKASKLKDVLYNVDGSLFFNNMLVTSCMCGSNMIGESGSLNCCIQSGITQLGALQKSLNMSDNDIYNARNLISTEANITNIYGELKTPLSLDIQNGITKLPMQRSFLHMGGQDIQSVGKLTCRDGLIKNFSSKKSVLGEVICDNLYFTKGIYCNDNHRYNMILNCTHTDYETLQFYTSGETSRNKDVKMELKNCDQYKMKLYGNLNLDNNNIINVNTISLNNIHLNGQNGILYYNNKKVYDEEKLIEDLKKDFLILSYNGMQLDSADRWGPLTKNLLSDDIYQKYTDNNSNLYSSISNRNITLNNGYITLLPNNYRIKAKIIFNLDLILSTTIKFSCYDNDTKIKESLKNLEQDGQYVFELDFLYTSTENTQLKFKIETDSEIISNENELDLHIEITETY